MNRIPLVDEHEILHDISVVIPTLGRPVLSECLRSIQDSQTWPAALFVVDQSSSPHIAERLREMRDAGLNATHVPMRGIGIATGTNHGLRQVRTPIVAVTHDDCRVQRDWLGSLRDRVILEGLAVLTGRVLPEGDAEVPSVITSTVAVTYTRPLPGRDVLYPANMAFPRAVLDAVGFMDEDPLLAAASEDNEWAYRVLRAGIPIVYDPQAVVTHLAWRDDADLARLVWAYARSQGAFYGKYLRRADPFLARRAIFDLLRAVWWQVRGALSHDRALAERGRAGSIGLAQGIVHGFLRGRPVVRPATSRWTGRPAT